MNGKQIKYSKHAEEQIKERNIKKTMVRETLLEPQQVITSKSGREIAHRVYNIRGRDFLPRIVFVNREHFIEVITTYLTTKIEKYWRHES